MFAAGIGRRRLERRANYESVFRIVTSVAKAVRATKLSGGRTANAGDRRGSLRTGAKFLFARQRRKGCTGGLSSRSGRTIKGRLKTKVHNRLVEQELPFLRPLSRPAYVVDQGKVVDMIPNDQLGKRRQKLHDLSLGV